MIKKLFKAGVTAVFLTAAWPMAAVSGFGRIRAIYGVFAHLVALGPGLPGDYLRIAYYRLTLARCSMSSRVSFGSFFAHPDTRVGTGVYIGSYCIIGNADIGDGAQIASAVQVLSGRHQHTRHEDGSISGAEEGRFVRVAIGPDCWIGAAAIIMADIGARTTIGAGSVVTKPIPEGCVAVGSPARVIEGRAVSP